MTFEDSCNKILSFVKTREYVFRHNIEDYFYNIEPKLRDLETGDYLSGADHPFYYSTQAKALNWLIKNGYLKMDGMRIRINRIVKIQRYHFGNE